MEKEKKKINARRIGYNETFQRRLTTVVEKKKNPPGERNRVMFFDTF